MESKHIKNIQRQFIKSAFNKVRGINPEFGNKIDAILEFQGDKEALKDYLLSQGDEKEMMKLINDGALEDILKLKSIL